MENETINVKNIVDLNGKVTDEMLMSKISSFNEVYRNNLVALSKIIGNAPIYFSDNNFLFLENTINSLGVNAVARLFKFAYLPGFMKGASVLSDANNMNKFKFLYVNVLGNSLDNFDVLEFIDILNKYEKYYGFCNNLLQSNITEDSKNSLFRLFKSNVSAVTVNSTDELRNINNTMSNYHNNIILNGDLDAVKNSIFLLLINKEMKDVKFILSRIINYEKIGHLKDSFKGAPLQDLLDNYGNMLSLLNEILESNDLNKLRQFALSLTAKSFSKSNTSFTLVKEFSDLEKKAKKLYTLELNGSLTDVDDLKPSETVKVEKGKFSASGAVMTDGTSLSGRKVDFIEIDEEASFLIHVTNVNKRYDGKGHYITDWKNPKLVGRTYICLSSFDNRSDTFHDAGFQEVPDINTHIKLLFNKFDLNSLCTFGNTDISFGPPPLEIAENNLHLGSANDVNADNLDTFGAHRRAYNPHWAVDEYDFLRESFSGKTIYPCAIAVIGDAPSQHEIDAAAYLGVPLIKINHISTMRYDRCANNPENSKLTSSIISPNNQAAVSSSIASVSELFKSLDSSLTDEQIACSNPNFDRGIDSFEIDKFIGKDVKEIYEKDMLFTNIKRLELILNKIERDNLFDDKKALSVLESIVSYIQTDYKSVLNNDKVDLNKYFIVLDNVLKKIGLNHNFLEQDNLVDLVLNERKTQTFIDKNIPNQDNKKSISLDVLSDLDAISKFICERYKFMVSHNIDNDKIFSEAFDCFGHLQKKLLVIMDEKHIIELRKNHDGVPEFLTVVDALLKRLGVSIEDLLDENKRSNFTSKMDKFLDKKLDQIEKEAVTEEKDAGISR